jgi:hypothetical protein
MKSGAFTTLTEVPGPFTAVDGNARESGIQGTWAVYGRIAQEAELWKLVEKIEDVKRLGMIPQATSYWTVAPELRSGKSRLESAEKMVTAEVKRRIPTLLKDVEGGSHFPLPVQRLLSALVILNEMKETA